MNSLLLNRPWVCFSNCWWILGYKFHYCIYQNVLPCWPLFWLVRTVGCLSLLAACIAPSNIMKVTSEGVDTKGRFSHNWYFNNTTPVLKSPGTSQKRGKNNYESQKTKKYVVRVCLLVVSGATSIKTSPTWLPKKELNKGKTINMSKQTGENTRLQPYTYVRASAHTHTHRIDN